MPPSRFRLLLAPSLALCLGASVQADVPPAVERSDHVTRAPLDPDGFFEALVDRYRNLSHYEDQTHVIQVTERDGEGPKTMDRRFECEIDGGLLHIETAATQFARKLGLLTPIQTGPRLEGLRNEYRLWMAPHLTLYFADKPLEEFRGGVSEAFRATEAESVRVEDRDLVRLELRSPGLSEDCEASFDLFVDPESMLIEKIDGQERLPDGGTSRTTVFITPTLVVDDEVAAPVGAP